MGHIFITGGIGSGKTTLAGRLGAATGLPVISLDEVFFDLASGNHREKRVPDDRGRLLAEHLRNDCRIFEGWHFGEWLFPLYSAVALAVIIDVPLELRRQRIQERFNRRKAGSESDPFPKGGIEHLENLLRWTALFNPDKTEAEIRSAAPATIEVVRTDGSENELETIAQRTHAPGPYPTSHTMLGSDAPRHH